MSKPTSHSYDALVVGVGPGLGAALVRQFASQGLSVAALGRHPEKQSYLEDEFPEKVKAFPCDASQKKDVEAFFRDNQEQLQDLDLFVFNAGAFQPGSILEISAETFEQCWQVGCLAGFLTAQRAAQIMSRRQQGTIIFTGATASLRGGPKFANLAVPKFGLRALAQSMARELAPQNIHVAHVIIDGQIESERYEHLRHERGPDSLLKPEAIAENYWHLYQQDRSTWSLELDLRPWVEKF